MMDILYELAIDVLTLAGALFFLSIPVMLIVIPSLWLWTNDSEEKLKKDWENLYLSIRALRKKIHSQKTPSGFAGMDNAAREIQRRANHETCRG